MTAIGGYNVYAQPQIQERTARQTPQNSDDSTEAAAKPNASREELFRSLLKANESSETNVSAGSGAVKADASQGRGQFVDLLV